MRRTLSSFLAVCSIAFALFASLRNPATLPAQPSLTANVSHPRLLAAYNKLPLAFEPNRGQTDARAQFLTRGAGYTVFLAGAEAAIRLQSSPSGYSHAPATTSIVRIVLAHSNPRPQPERSILYPAAATI